MATIRVGNQLYGKPSLTDLPYDLGVRIFKQIMEAPRISPEEDAQEARKIEQHILEEEGIVE